MGNFKDLTGQKFGRLTVIEKDDENGIYWKCKCECGNEVVVSKYSLLSGNTMSCSCLHRDEVRNRMTKHGLTNTRLYRIWQGMKNRCYNSNYHDFSYCGARGITVCEEWKNNFQNFYNWSMNNGYMDNLTIDRIDNNGNYEPNNCRWITNEEQQQNKRNMRYLTCNGKTHSISEWARITGMDRKTISYRLDKCNLSVEQALTIKPSLKNKNLGKQKEI